MSYDIIKGIKIKDGKVMLNCAANNVYPRRYRWEESYSLTDILKEKGQKVLDMTILREYEKGCFQPGTPNKYSKAVNRLRHMPAYKNYDWRPWRLDPEEDNKIEANRKSTAFDDLLYQAFQTRDSKTRHIIVKRYMKEDIYVFRVGSRHISYTRNIKEAKKYIFPEEAQRLIEVINDAQKENYSVMPLPTGQLSKSNGEIFCNPLN